MNRLFLVRFLGVIGSFHNEIENLIDLVGTGVMKQGGMGN